MVSRIAIIVLILSSCKEKVSSYPIFEINDILSHEKTYTIPDSLGVATQANIENIQFVGDSLIFFTDSYIGIFKLNRKTGKIKQLSRLGVGPGEYERPSCLQIYNDTIFFSDSQSRLSMIDFNGNYLNQKTSKQWIGSSNFVRLNGNYYFTTHPQHSKNYIVSPRDFHKDSSAALFHIPTVFRKTRYNNAHGGGLEAVNNSLYYMNSFEATIYKYNSDEDEEKRIDITNIPYFTSWKSYYNNKMLTKDFNDFFSKNGWVINFWAINNSKFLISVFSHKLGYSNSPNFAVDETGRILFRLNGRRKCINNNEIFHQIIYYSGKHILSIDGDKEGNRFFTLYKWKTPNKS